MLIKKQTPQRAKSTKLANLGYGLIGCWLLLGLLPLLLTIIGFQYLPTVDWVSQCMGAALSAAIVSAAICMSIAVVRGETKEIGIGEARKALAVIVSPVFGFFISYSAVMAGGPAIVALVAGHNVEHIYTVSGVQMGRSRKCGNSITIDQLPIVAKRLCYISEEVRKTLHPGVQIAITGRGSRFGVFARQLRRID